MAVIGVVITFYRSSQLIERFRSRISFLDVLQSLTNFKRHVENFLSLMEKVRELGKARELRVNRSFSLSRNKKKSTTIQWKKLRDFDVIEDN